jgi:hypothetical protein
VVAWLLEAEIERVGYIIAVLAVGFGAGDLPYVPTMCGHQQRRIFMVRTTSGTEAKRVR